VQYSRATFVIGLFSAVLASTQGAMAKDHKAAIDGEDAYKANCTLCHIAIHTYSPRTMATVMNHMRVRANMTGDESEAILKYLVEPGKDDTERGRQTTEKGTGQ
jgi:hypothetical protein